MPTITVKDVIKAELLKVCLETTAKLRNKHEKKEKKEKYTTEEVQKVRGAFQAIGWSTDQVDKQMEALSILHDAPELKKPTIPTMELFCVMVADKNGSGHPDIGRPVIWTKKRDAASAYYMDVQGRVEGNHMAYIPDAIRFASCDEVQRCIDNLNEDQWRRIRSDTLFKEIMEKAMSMTVTVESGAEDEKENGEISIYGRAITVADE